MMFVAVAFFFFLCFQCGKNANHNHLTSFEESAFVISVFRGRQWEGVGEKAQNKKNCESGKDSSPWMIII